MMTPMDYLLIFCWAAGVGTGITLFINLFIQLKKMKIDKQLLKVFTVVTAAPIVIAIIGSFMNFVISCVFMCEFRDIQCSAIWVLHGLVGLFFTIMLLGDE